MKKIIIPLLILVALIIRFVYVNNDQNKLKKLYNNPIKINEYYENYIYAEYKDHVTIMYYQGDEKEVIIPEKINNKPVYSIDDSAFYGNSKIEKIVIPNKVIRIGHQAFIGNRNLTEVTLPDNLIEIGPYSFDVCPKLKKINVKKGSKTEKALKKTKFYDLINYI